MMKTTDPLQPSQSGFTMIELLVTMLLLTVVMTGTAALQIGVIRQTTLSRRMGEANLLAQQVLARYKSAQYTNLVATGGNWTTELQRDGATQMVNVAADGQSIGPYTVRRIVEATGGGFLITIEVSWLDVAQRAGTTGQYQAQNVTVTLSRFS